MLLIGVTQSVFPLHAGTLCKKFAEVIRYRFVKFQIKQLIH